MPADGDLGQAIAPAPGLSGTPSGGAVLEQALWRDLSQEADEAAFGSAWLGLTCRTLPGAIAGVLLTRDAATGGFRPWAVWPPGAGVSAPLARAAQAAADTGRGAVQPAEAGGSSSLALPLVLDGATVAIAAIDVTLGPPPRDARGAMRHLQWAAAWVRERLRAGQVGRQADAATRMEVAIDLLAAAMEQPGLAASCRVAATELAARLDCERVAIGFVHRGRSRVESISNSAAFGERMTLTRLIEAAMDEAIDQESVLLVAGPQNEAGEGPLITRAHGALAGQHTPAAVMTVPMVARDAAFGAVTFERPADRPFSQADVDVAEAVVAILGPSFADKRAADRWIVPQLGDLLLRQARRLFGPRFLGRKLVALGLAGLLAASWFVTATYEVHARARINGTVRRAVVAPFDGFLREAPFQAGDRVRAGALLAAFDDRDLVLERLRWVTERQVHAGEYDEALSARKRADAVRLESQLEQADAQIHLADEQLARTRLLAPFEGLVVSGDMSQSIGAPVRRGDVLFELAPLDGYRVDLDIGEAQVSDVAVGEAGRLVLASLPEDTLSFTVSRVTPVAEARDGAMTFRAEGRLSGEAGGEAGGGMGRLRPGMEGVAKIEAGRARVVWIWSRSFLHWLRLATWAWLP